LAYLQQPENRQENGSVEGQLEDFQTASEPMGHGWILADRSWNWKGASRFERFARRKEELRGDPRYPRRNGHRNRLSGSGRKPLKKNDFFRWGILQRVLWESGISVKLKVSGEGFFQKLIDE